MNCISEGIFSIEDTVIDVIDVEKPENLVISVPQRRFSYSVPNDIHQPTIIIPQSDVDIEDNINFFDISELDLNINLGLYKEIMLINSSENNETYNIPPKSSADARIIWLQARIPSPASLYEIEKKLLDWALLYAHLDIVETKISKIRWIIPSGATCSATWKSFLHWMTSASFSDKVPK